MTRRHFVFVIIIYKAKSGDEMASILSLADTPEVLDTTLEIADDKCNVEIFFLQ